MLRGLSDLKRFTIAGTDGNLGSVRDLCFDDRSWIVRYLVVEPARDAGAAGRPVPCERAHHNASLSQASNRDLDHLPVQSSGFVGPRTNIDKAIQIEGEVAGVTSIKNEIRVT